MFFQSVYTVLFLAAAVSADGPVVSANCVGINAIRPACVSKESAYVRDFFHINGNYQISGTTNQSIIVNQFYVEKLTPKEGAKKRDPIVLFTAGVPSGAAWLNTPDNRKGWASWFLDKGYRVYIVDQTGMGRGSQNDVAAWPTRLSTTDLITQNSYTAPQILNAYPQSQLHTQWPGSGVRGDPIFDAFMAAFLPIPSNTTTQELSMRAAGCELLRLIGPAYTISHSIGSSYPILMSDQCPDLILGNINLEAGNIPFQSYVGNSTHPSVGRTTSRPWGLTNTPITYDPPITAPSQLSTVTVGNDTAALRSCIMQTNGTVHTLPKIAKVPYLLITGEASPHITYDHCLINFLEQAGVHTDWIKLGEIGIHGNAHFFYLEKNNLDIAAVAESWIRNHTVSKNHTGDH